MTNQELKKSGVTPQNENKNENVSDEELAKVAGGGTKIVRQAGGICDKNRVDD